MAVPVASPNKEINVVLEFARTVQKDIYSWVCKTLSLK